MRDFIKFLKEWIISLFSNKSMIEFAQPLKTDDVKIVGRNAKDLIENPAFLTSIKKLEEYYFNIWKSSKPMDSEPREAVWRELKALEAIKLKLTGMVNEMIIEQDKLKNKGVKQ